MILWFNTTKATQAAGVLLDFEDGKMEYLRLLKLLYIADRESIYETGRPISYSQSTAMGNGPLSSDVYDLINGRRDDFELWAQHIRTHGCDIKLMSPPGRGLLSKYEIDKLNRVSQQHEQLNTFDLSRKTHRFEEWKLHKPTPPGPKSKPIPFFAILDGLKLSSEQKQAIVADLQSKAQADRLFAGVAK